MSDYGDNVWVELEDMGDGISGRRLRREEGARLVAAVWELAPGSDGVQYHFHHGLEELLVVLRGRPLLRGAAAHSLSNPTEEPVRYLMAGARADAPLDIIEYLDEGTFVAYAKTNSQRGEPFFVRRLIDEPDA